MWELFIREYETGLKDAPRSTSRLRRFSRASKGDWGFFVLSTIIFLIVACVTHLFKIWDDFPTVIAGFVYIPLIYWKRGRIDKKFAKMTALEDYKVSRIEPLEQAARKYSLVSLEGMDEIIRACEKKIQPKWTASTMSVVVSCIMGGFTLLYALLHQSETVALVTLLLVPYIFVICSMVAAISEMVSKKYLYENLQKDAGWLRAQYTNKGTSAL